MITYTKGQQLLLTKLEHFLADPEKDEFVISGAAGTGKTFCISEILHKTSKNIIGCALSNAAVEQLATSLGAKVTCITIAKLLGMNMVHDEHGNIKFKPQYVKRGEKLELPIENCEILIVDEASMVTTEVRDLIFRHKRASCKVIFMGDICQLYGINSTTGAVEISPVFDHVDVELDEVVRYSGPIHRLSVGIRDTILHEAYNPHIINELTSRTTEVESDTGYVFYNNPLDIINTVIDHMRAQQDVQVIAYFNDTVDKTNTYIRSRYYNKPIEQLRQFEDNEVIILQAPYFLNDGVLTNNMLLRVRAVEPCIGPYEVPCLKLTVDRTTEPVYTVDLTLGSKKYNRLLYSKTEAAKANPSLWEYVTAFKQAFLQYKYGYAVTCYKAQGRTISNVVVFEEEMMNASRLGLDAKLRSVYTAISRSSKMCYIYNKKYKVW
jgi:exodeoxyribonuclease V